ncbi:hypothetical protein MA16_Dca024747 [Dendrobium catenatum]|uniref:Uncharacterized protein n=1 Tax=Dendrobium catenatum TaxID=906689 RepID=A0A2I0WG10_9ASPA|nr:hypothetical protein MA16_Dca024747 [Dendrobium catenatum]
MKLPAIRPYLGLLDPTSYTHSGFRLELWELRFPMLILLKLVDLESSFVVVDFWSLRTFSGYSRLILRLEL